MTKLHAVIAAHPQSNRAWVITTGSTAQYTFEVDQICGSEREARKELKDLKAMGFDDAKMRAFATWAEAEDFQDRVRDAGGGPFRPATKLVKEA